MPFQVSRDLPHPDTVLHDLTYGVFQHRQEHFRRFPVHAPAAADDKVRMVNEIGTVSQSGTKTLEATAAGADKRGVFPEVKGFLQGFFVTQRREQENGNRKPETVEITLVACAVMEQASVEFTSPTTTTTPVRSSAQTFSNAIIIFAVCSAWVPDPALR